MQYQNVQFTDESLTFTLKKKKIRNLRFSEKRSTLQIQLKFYRV